MRKICLSSIFAVCLIGLFSFIPFKTSTNIDKRNYNVCKKLIGNSLVYVIFVESRESSNWDDFDMNSAKDSINKAVKWIQKQAEKNNIQNVNLQVEYYKNDSSQIVTQNVGASIKKILTKAEGADDINKWSDKVVKKATGLKNREKLISKLRDQYNVESVVLMFMLNNYYKAGYSYALNTMSETDVEYTLLGSKDPGYIASEIMSVFGAHYMYHHPSVLDKKNRAKLKELFPYDIMASPEKPITQLYVGELTQYYIGWKDQINAEYEKLIKEDKYKY